MPRKRTTALGETVPRPARAAAALPLPLTIFLTAPERREVVRALRRLDRDRARAIKRALGIDGRLPRTGRARRTRAGPAPWGCDGHQEGSRGP